MGPVVGLPRIPNAVAEPQAYQPPAVVAPLSRVCVASTVHALRGAHGEKAHLGNYAAV